MHNKQVLIEAIKNLGKAKAPARKKDVVINQRQSPYMQQPSLPTAKEGGESEEKEFVNSQEHGIDTPIYANVGIKKSKIHGDGLFTNQPIKEGTVIGVSHVRKEFEKNGEMYQAPFPSKILGMYNHSDEANIAEIDNGDYISLIAIRDIQPGEELVSNYYNNNIEDLEKPEDFKNDLIKARYGLPGISKNALKLGSNVIKLLNSENPIQRNLAKAIVESGMKIAPSVAPELLKDLGIMAGRLSNSGASYDVGKFLKHLQSSGGGYNTGADHNIDKKAYFGQGALYYGTEPEEYPDHLFKYGEGQRDLLSLYFKGDETGFKELPWKSELEPRGSLSKYIDVHGPLKSYELQSEILHGDPISGKIFFEDFGIADPNMSQADFEKHVMPPDGHAPVWDMINSPMETSYIPYQAYEDWKRKISRSAWPTRDKDKLIKSFNQVFDRFGNIIPIERNSKVPGRFKNRRYLDSYDDIEGHMQYLRRINPTTFDLTTRDVWGFHPIDFSKKYYGHLEGYDHTTNAAKDFDAYLKSLGARLFGDPRIGKPFILTKTNPLSFDDYFWDNYSLSKKYGGQYNSRVLRDLDRDLKDPRRSKRFSKSLLATNQLFAPNYLFNKPSPRRIYNPNAKYFRDGGPMVKQRRGVRENSDGSESTHLMRAEYVPGRGWVGFPSLFQDSKPYADDSQNWVDMSEEEDWMKIYEEAERRGEVYDFGEDKEAALAFGEGSWKNQLSDEFIEAELSEEEIQNYVDGGYIVEDLPKADKGLIMKAAKNLGKVIPNTSKSYLPIDYLSNIAKFADQSNIFHSDVLSTYLPKVMAAKNLLTQQIDPNSNALLTKGIEGVLGNDLVRLGNRSLSLEDMNLLPSHLQHNILHGSQTSDALRKAVNEYALNPYPMEGLGFSKSLKEMSALNDGIITFPLNEFYHGFKGQGDFDLENLELDRSNIPLEQLKSWTTTGKSSKSANTSNAKHQYGLFGSFNLNSSRDPAIKYSGNALKMASSLIDNPNIPIKDRKSLIKNIQLDNNVKLLDINYAHKEKAKEIFRDILDLKKGTPEYNLNFPAGISGNLNLTEKAAKKLKDKYGIDGIINTNFGELVVTNKDVIKGVQNRDFKLYDYVNPLDLYTGGLYSINENLLRSLKQRGGLDLLLKQNDYYHPILNSPRGELDSWIEPEMKFTSDVFLPGGRYWSKSNDPVRDAIDIYKDKTLYGWGRFGNTKRFYNLGHPVYEGKGIVPRDTDYKYPFTSEWFDRLHPDNLDLIRKKGGEIPKADLGKIVKLAPKLFKPINTFTNFSKSIPQSIKRNQLAKIHPETMELISKLKNKNILSSTLDEAALIKYPNLLNLATKKGIQNALTFARSTTPSLLQGTSSSGTKTPLSATDLSAIFNYKLLNDEPGLAMYTASHVPGMRYGRRDGLPRLPYKTIKIGGRQAGTPESLDALYTHPQISGVPQNIKEGIFGDTYGSYATILRYPFDYSGSASDMFNRYKAFENTVFDKARILRDSGGKGAKAGDIGALNFVDEINWPNNVFYQSILSRASEVPFIGHPGQKVLQPVATYTKPIVQEIKAERDRIDKLYKEGKYEELINALNEKVKSGDFGSVDSNIKSYEIDPKLPRFDVSKYNLLETDLVGTIPFTLDIFDPKTGLIPTDPSSSYLKNHEFFQGDLSKIAKRAQQAYHHFIEQAPLMDAFRDPTNVVKYSYSPFKWKFKKGGSIPKAHLGRIVKLTSNLTKPVGIYKNQFKTTSNIGKFAGSKGNINLNQLKAAIGKESMGLTHKWPILEKQLIKEFGEMPTSLPFSEIQRVTNDAIVPYTLSINPDGNYNYGVWKQDLPGIFKGQPRLSLGFTREKYPTNFVPLTYEPLSQKTLVLKGLGQGSAVHKNPEGTLAHAHLYIDPDARDTWTITQEQSDPFEGKHHIWNNAEKHLETLKKQNLIEEKKPIQYGGAKYEAAKKLKNDIDNLKASGILGEKHDEIIGDIFSTPLEGPLKGVSSLKDLESIINNPEPLENPKVQQNNRKILELENAIIAAKGPNPKQKELLEKNWESVMLQQLMTEAAAEGMKKMRLPTGETTIKVQNFHKIPQWTQQDRIDVQNIFNTGNFGDAIDNIREAGSQLTRLLKTDYSKQHKTIIRRYDKLPKLLKKTFGFTDDQIKLVTDRNGNTWFEVEIPESFLQGQGQIIHKFGGSINLGDEVDEATMNKLKAQGYTFEEI